MIRGEWNDTPPMEIQEEEQFISHIVIVELILVACDRAWGRHS